MGKRQYANGSGDLSKQNSSDSGPFYRAEWHSQLSDEYFYPEVTRHLSAGERAILLRLTRSTMGTKDKPELTLVVRAAVPFLMEYEPYKRTAIKCHLKSLEAKGFIRLIKQDKKEGNLWFIEPVYLWSDKWHRFEGVENSRFAQDLLKVGKRPTCDDLKLRWSEIDLPKVEKRPTCDASVGMEKVGKRPKFRSRSSDPDGAPSHSSTTPQGGEEDPASNGEKRSPNGHDQIPPCPPPGRAEKGAGLPAGEHSINWRKALDESEAKIKANAEFNQKFHALWKQHKIGKLSRKNLEAALDALSTEYGRETHFARAPNKKKKPVGNGALATLMPFP